MNYYDSSVHRRLSAGILTAEAPLRALSRNKWVVAGFAFLAILILTLIALTRTPAEFRTTAKLLVLLSDDYAAKPAPGSGATFLQTALDRDAYMSAESDILVSDAVIERAIADIGAEALYPDSGKSPGVLRSLVQAAGGFISGFRLQENDPEKLASINARNAVVKSLKVDIGHSGNVITVSYDNPNRYMSARFLTALIGNYFARRASLFADDQSITLSQQVETKGKELDAARADLTAFQQTYAISDFALQRELLLRRLAELEKELQSSEVDGDEASARRDTVIQQLNAVPPAFVRQVDGTQVQVRSGTVATSLQQEANKLEQTLKAAEVRKQGIQDRIAGVRAQLEVLNEHEGQANDLKLRQDVLERQYAQGLQALYERKSVEAVAQSWRSNVKLLDKVRIPTRPTTQRLLIATTGAVLALFAFGASLALSLVFARRKEGDGKTSTALFHRARMRFAASSSHSRSAPSSLEDAQ